MSRLLSLLTVFALASPTWADAEKTVKQQLEKLKGEGAAVAVLKDDAVKRSFPQHEFVTVLFRQFPVARVAPEPLGSSNIYAVTKDDKLTLIKDGKTLEAFFKRGKFGENADALKDVMRSWLKLSAQLAQDGFYQFKVEEDSLKVTGGKVTGKIVVTEGGNGEINAKMEVSDGMLTEWSSDMKLRAGMRPRCQATLLLHPEPLVRQLAEQDLLVIGKLAKPYLDDQRAKASPELRKEIDRVWQRILTER